MADAQRRRIVLEPVGPAGSGKTTLVRALAARTELVVKGVPIRRTEKAWSLLRICGILGLLLPRALRDGSWFGWQDLRSMIYLDAWRRALVKDPKVGTIVLLDHGPLFRMARLCEFGPPAARTARFQRWIDARLAEWGEVLGLVVHLDAPEDVLLARIRGRETNHELKGGSDERGRAVLARYRRAYEEILDRLAECCDNTPLRLDTSREPSDAVAEAVWRRLSGSGAPAPEHERTPGAVQQR